MPKPTPAEPTLGKQLPATVASGEPSTEAAMFVLVTVTLTSCHVSVKPAMVPVLAPVPLPSVHCPLHVTFTQQPASQPYDNPLVVVSPHPPAHTRT